MRVCINWAFQTKQKWRRGMNINVKFYMYFNGERIRTLEDLRENFIAEDVLERIAAGSWRNG